MKKEKIETLENLKILAKESFQVLTPCPNRKGKFDLRFKSIVILIYILS